MTDLLGSRRFGLATAILLAALVLLIAATPGARAAFPGVNGKIAVSECIPCDGTPSRMWTLNPDGGERMRVGGELVYDPIFSGTGDRIAYTERDGQSPVANAVNIYTANPDGTDVEQVTDEVVSSYDADISSDGKKIVFVSPRTFENGQLNYDLYLANSDGSDPQRLTTAEGDDATPVFSPDDKTIAFTSYRDGDGEIFTIGVDGTDEQRLTDNATVDDSPDYSPDGNRILFRSRRNDTGSGPYRSDLFLMDADGSNVTEALAPTPGIYEYRAVFSPDGEKIALSASPPAAPADLFFDTYVAPLGGSPKNITNSPEFSERDVDWQRVPKSVAETCKLRYPNLRGPLHSLIGGELDDGIRAGKGDDRLGGRRGTDCLLGQGGDDSLRGGGGDDELFGGPGADVLRGSGGADRIECGRGRDRVVVSAEGDDRVADDCEQVVGGA